MVTQSNIAVSAPVRISGFRVAAAVTFRAAAEMLARGCMASLAGREI